MHIKYGIDLMSLNFTTLCSIILLLILSCVGITVFGKHIKHCDHGSTALSNTNGIRQETRAMATILYLHMPPTDISQNVSLRERHSFYNILLVL